MLNIFVIFIISFFKLFGYVDLTHKIEIILLSFLLLAFINNLIFQKLIIFKNFEKLILIINTLILINLFIFISFLEFKNFTNFYVYILVCLNILPLIISIRYYIFTKKYNLLLSQLFILGSFPATSLLLFLDNLKYKKYFLNYFNIFFIVIYIFCNWMFLPSFIYLLFITINFFIILKNKNWYFQL